MFNFFISIPRGSEESKVSDSPLIINRTVAAYSLTVVKPLTIYDGLETVLFKRYFTDKMYRPFKKHLMKKISSCSFLSMDTDSVSN